ncbi:alpha/beta-hydrolase [Stipitochalara longipes BDJ]|nr:alpha/beta-hydrolase [Stipitochalara longipes BDJ]
MKHHGARGRSSVALSLFAATLLLHGCSAINSKAQTPLHEINPTSSLKWETCGDLNNHILECARLDVPMDHLNKSKDKTFSIPLIRMLATNASDTGNRTILLNPGGPGGSGVNFLLRAGEKVNKIVGEGFHLLSFDPRGVNGSIPKSSCYVSPEQRAEEIENIPWDLEFQAGEMYSKAENKVKACEDTMGEYGGYINTPQTAADMNSILDAIGQEKMYYWGFSYGTTLGQTYAQMFPDRVFRLIIDGVSNLDEWYNGVFYYESLDDTDKVYAGFVEECFKAKENCPLNSIKGQSFNTAADLKTYIDDYLKNLEGEPIPVYLNNSNYGAVTRRSLVTNGIFSALYKPDPAWPILANNLAALLNGNSTPVFNAYSDLWISSIIGDETNTFVTLNDAWKTGSEAPFHGLKPIKNFSLGIPETSKLVTKYQGSDIFDRASWSLPKTHDFHPQYHPEFPKVETAEPILVLSTTFDPVCPLISAQKAHNSFKGAGLVEQKSYGHCSISMPSLCTAKHVRRYFYEGVLPEAGAT